MKLLLLLIGLVLVLEGLPYVAAPEKMKEWLAMLSEMDPAHLRIFGLLAIGGGLLICWIVQKTNLFT